MSRSVTPFDQEPDAEAFFRWLWSCRGISIQEIADYYGVSRQAIYDRAKRRVLPLRGGVRADAQVKDRATFRAMWLGGVQRSDIADYFGVSVHVVSNCARIERLPRRRRGRGAGGKGGWGAVPLSVWREERLAQAMQQQETARSRKPPHDPTDRDPA